MSASITPGQKKQIVRICEDAGGTAIDAVRLDREQAQRVIRRGDELRGVVIDKIRELSVSNQFANEEVPSSYGYPARYAVKPIEEQIATLRGFWPKLKPGGWIARFERTIKTEAGEEGLFAIVKWQSFGSTYNDGLKKEVLAAIASSRPFYNYYPEGQLGPQYLRQQERTTRMFHKLDDQQKGDILVIPAQFGLRHRGRSVRRAREVFVANEFGLGSFATGIMLLTHPERLVQWEQLHVDCPGDEYSPGADGRFELAPYFGFLGGRVGFDARWTGYASGHCGSVSAFLPQ